MTIIYLLITQAALIVLLIVGMFLGFKWMRYPYDNEEKLKKQITELTRRLNRRHEDIKQRDNELKRLRAEYEAHKIK